MRIGVVSDTHNQMSNVARIVELLNAAAVERVVHTGDITQAKTLEVLARLEAPLVGVYGNNDRERSALEEASAVHGIELHDPPLRLRWREREILVVHDPRELAGHDRHELALHGHTHLHVDRVEGGRRIFNPGECAGFLRGHNAIGVVDLATPALETDLIRF